MKKLFITAFGVITLLSCSNNENNSQESSIHTVATTNRLKIGYDLTNDGVENFIDNSQQSDNSYVYQFEYKSAEKTLTVSTLNGGVLTLAESYRVQSSENGNLKCHSPLNDCVFRFIAEKEVHQIVKVNGGEQRIKYYYQ